LRRPHSDAILLLCALVPQIFDQETAMHLGDEVG
jgi:hypothetical protein